MPAIDFERDLNSEQFGAVMAPDGPLLVLAAAGTGKTRTLVYRVARLVEQGVPTSRILLLTFTNRAADEMLDRAGMLVGRGVGDMWGGTFHHMANRMLRSNAALLGYAADYTILDRDDSRTLVRDCIAEFNLQCKEFPKPDVLLAVSGEVANTGAPIENVVADRFMDHPIDAGDIMRVLNEYRDRKRKIDAMDFDDLLANGLKLLQENVHVLAGYQEKFLHVLVDEYQDINTIQTRLVDSISAKNRNLFVVGDDFQCIYSWRGASFESIMTFPERYADARTFKLETNYRSVPEILEVANACIAGNPRQFLKTLRPTRAPHRRPVLAHLRDGEHQAGYVVEQIQRLCREGLRASEIAVLYRAHYHAMELQMLLTRARIPYLITSGMRFFEQAHIKDVCSILRVIHNPKDEVSFARLLRLIPRVGQQTAAKAWSALGGKFDARDKKDRQSLMRAIPPAARETWKTVDLIFGEYETEHLAQDAGEVIHRFVEAFYGRYSLNNFEDSERRIDDINELVLFTAKFESVQEFLSEIALMSSVDAEREATEIDKLDMVKLSTVHQAKGLEWRAVIVLWATEGMFPLSRSLAESPQAEAEERRLFYVAITRAKDELFFCMPEMRRTPDGGVMYCLPSRFIDELPAKLVREVRPGRF